MENPKIPFYHFSIDDVFDSLIEVSDSSSNFFSNSFFKFLDTIHSKYNANVDLYCFYQKSIKNKFRTLSDVSDKHKEIFANNPWLHLGPHALDYDKEMVSKSIESSKNNSPHIEYFLMSMDDIDQTKIFFEDSFDLIYSVYAFYYTQDEFKLLDNLKRKLKQNGRISIIGPHSDNNKNWWNFLEQFMKVDDSLKIHANTEFMKGVEKYARENFKEIILDEFVNQITIPSIDVFRQYWKSNIYYDAKFDSEFDAYAKKHFDEFGIFQYSKKAEIITMKVPLHSS